MAKYENRFKNGVLMCTSTFRSYYGSKGVNHQCELPAGHHGNHFSEHLRRRQQHNQVQKVRYGWYTNWKPRKDPPPTGTWRNWRRWHHHLKTGESY